MKTLLQVILLASLNSVEVRSGEYEKQEIALRAIDISCRIKPYSESRGWEQVVSWKIPNGLIEGVVRTRSVEAVYNEDCDDFKFSVLEQFGREFLVDSDVSVTQEIRSRVGRKVCGVGREGIPKYCIYRYDVRVTKEKNRFEILGIKFYGLTKIEKAL